MNPYDRFVVIFWTFIALLACAYFVVQFYVIFHFLQKYW